MGIPATQIYLHHTDPSFHKSSSDQQPLPPFFASIAIAHLVRFLGQVERILTPGTRCQHKSESLLSIRIPARQQSRLILLLMVSFQIIEHLQQGGSILHTIERHTFGLFQFINNKNGSYSEFGEAAATNKKAGAAGLSLAFAGGAMMLLGAHHPHMPSLTFGAHGVGVAKKLAW